MSAPFVPALDTFSGGQMTDLPAYTGAYDATALLELVSPGNPEQAVNYSITLQLLAAFVTATQSLNPTIVTAATYASVAGDTRILSEQPSARTCTVTMLQSLNYSTPVLVKDVNGTADVSTPLVINFSGGQTCDGLTSISITNPYGWVWLNPLPNNGGFYET